MINLVNCHWRLVWSAVAIGMLAAPECLEAQLHARLSPSSNAEVGIGPYASVDVTESNVSANANVHPAGTSAQEQPVLVGRPADADGENAVSTIDASPWTCNPRQTEPTCGKKKQEALRLQVAAAHAGAPGPFTGPFYANDFSYIDDPCYCDWHLGDSFKRLPLGQRTTIDIGGEYRMRFHDEENIRGLGLTGRDDEFLLQRTRLYADIKRRRFRLYSEVLDARSSYEELTPRPIEENDLDFQNLFADITLADVDRGKLIGRIGRQELQYDAQRQVSPLDWANTRQTFEGVRLMWQGSTWDVDGFWVNPVPVDRRNWDEPNYDQKLYGCYATYKRLAEGRTANVYYLGFDNDVGDIDYHTLGTHLTGDRDGWLWETELAYQFGTMAGASHAAGAMTWGVGRKMSQFKNAPTLWMYYDWASGSDTFNNGYFHHFPLAHKYLGFMDLFGRRNIKDLNFLFTVPILNKKVNFLAWYHIFQLQDPDDIPYSVAMGRSSTPPGVTAVPGQSDNLGTEIDLVFSYNVTSRSNLMVGYSHFETGAFYRTNPTAPTAENADFFYTQWTTRF